MSAPLAGSAVTPVGQVIETLQAAGVRTARVSHCDLFGKCRSKELPVARLELAAAGLGYCLISMIEDIHGNPLDLPGFAGDSSFPDMHAVADLTTGRVLPWEPDTAWFISDLHNDRGLSPRGALRRACLQLDALGISAVIAPELEFYLLHGGEAQARYGGRHRPRLHDRAPRGSHWGGQAHAPGAGRPRTGGHHRKSRVLARTVRDQSSPRPGARGRRPGLPVQGGGAGARPPGWARGQLHGQAVLRRGRVELPHARLSDARRGEPLRTA